MSEELKSKATELGIEFDEETSEDELKDLVDRKENDIEYWREQAKFNKEEAKKAFKKRDDERLEKRRLLDKIKDVEGRLQNSVDGEEFKSLKTELEDLKKFKEEIDREREEKELAQASEVEKTKFRFEKQMEKLQEDFEKFKKTSESKIEETKTKLESKDKVIENLRGNKLEVDIVKAATKFSAWNPDQIVALTRSYFTYDEQLDKFSHLSRDAQGKIKDELTVEEFIKNYLQQEENENLIRSKAAEGGFDTKVRTDTKRAKEVHKGFYDPDSEQIKKEALDRDLKPEVWAKIKEKQDRKLGKIKD